MVRPPIGTNCWPSIISGIALVFCVLSSPIGIPQAPNTRVTPNSSSRKFALTSDGTGVALTSATPSGAFIDADRSKIILENEGESHYSFYLVSPAFIAPDGPPKVLSGPLPGNSSSRTVAVPLRC